MLPGCHVAEADAEAAGTPTAAGPEPSALIALAVGCTATRAVTPATLRDSAAAGREPATPTDRTGVWRATRLAAAPEGRCVTPPFAVADTPRLAEPPTDGESDATPSA